MKNIINWGIIGCGAIAPAFAEGLASLKNARIHAVASRDKERASALALRFDAKKIYLSYDDLAKDPDIDVVYIATTHNLHKDNALLCLNHNKAVLCEKPFTINSLEAQQVIKVARDKNLFLMEAMWTRFFPAMQKVREWLKQGLIGDIKMIKADFGFKTEWDSQRRHLNRELAGGSLLDVGVYPVSLASMIMKKQPDIIRTNAIIGKTGVDEISAYMFGYEEDTIAILSSAINLKTPHDAVIIGTNGIITVYDFWHPQKIVLELENKNPETYHFSFESTGYNYEAQEVMNCLINGQTESSIVPLNETLGIMQTMDKIRAQWNLKYPGEEIN